MNRMQKLKGAAADSLRLKTSTNEPQMEMNGINWRSILWLIVVILFICAAPVILTQGALFGWEFFDLSDKGTIGDTIGGITAPIIGFLSIVLLWLTLQAQLRFNNKQYSINKEQQRFNDANRILAMESHILHLDENLFYGFTGFSGTLEGHSVSSLRLLVGKSITIAESELEHIIDRVHIIDIALCTMADYLEKCSLGAEEKKSTICMADLYLTYIHGFYNDVTDGNIKWISSIAEVYCEVIGAESSSERIKQKTLSYQEKIKPYLATCKKTLDE